jgi:hypothetical protein
MTLGEPHGTVVATTDKPFGGAAMKFSPSPGMQQRRPMLRGNAVRGVAAIAGTLVVAAVAGCGGQHVASAVQGVSTAKVPQTSAIATPTESATPTPAPTPSATQVPVESAVPATPQERPRTSGALFTVQVPAGWQIVTQADFAGAPPPPGLLLISDVKKANGSPVSTFRIDIIPLDTSVGGAVTLDAGKSILAYDLKQYEAVPVRTVTSTDVAGRPAVTYAFRGLFKGEPFNSIVVLSSRLKSATYIAIDTTDTIEAAQSVLDAILASWRWA